MLPEIPRAKSGAGSVLGNSGSYRNLNANVGRNDSIRASSKRPYNEGSDEDFYVNSAIRDKPQDISRKASAKAK